MQRAATLGANSSKLWELAIHFLIICSPLGNLSHVVPNELLNTSEPALTLPCYCWPFPKLTSSLPGLGNEHSRESLQPTLHLDSQHKEDSDPEDER